MLEVKPPKQRRTVTVAFRLCIYIKLSLWFCMLRLLPLCILHFPFCCAPPATEQGEGVCTGHSSLVMDASTSLLAQKRVIAKGGRSMYRFPAHTHCLLMKGEGAHGGIWSRGKPRNFTPFPFKKTKTKKKDPWPNINHLVHFHSSDYGLLRRDWCFKKKRRKENLIT